MGVCTLSEYLRFLKSKNQILSIKDISSIVLGLTTNIMAFHINGAAHRDIKPDNIILSRGLRNLKMADLGLS